MRKVDIQIQQQQQSLPVASCCFFPSTLPLFVFCHFSYCFHVQFYFKCFAKQLAKLSFSCWIVARFANVLFCCIVRGGGGLCKGSTVRNEIRIWAWLTVDHITFFRVTSCRAGWVYYRLQRDRSCNYFVVADAAAVHLPFGQPCQRPYPTSLSLYLCIFLSGLYNSISQKPQSFFMLFAFAFTPASAFAFAFFALTHFL